MTGAKTLKFSPQRVNKHKPCCSGYRRAHAQRYPLSEAQTYCSGRLQVSPLITTGTRNIWLPDFCPQPSQMSLKPSFICCTTNRHAKTWFGVIEACLATPSGLWHRGQAKQTSCHFPFQPLSTRERPISKNRGKAAQKSTCYALVSRLTLEYSKRFLIVSYVQRLR